MIYMTLYIMIFFIGMFTGFLLGYFASQSDINQEIMMGVGKYRLKNRSEKK